MFTSHSEDDVEVGAGVKEPVLGALCMARVLAMGRRGSKLTCLSSLSRLNQDIGWSPERDCSQKEGPPGQQNHFIRGRVSVFHLPCPTPGHPPH